MEYTPYEMLYAMQVFEGKRALNSIPISIRLNVGKRVAELEQEKLKSELGDHA